EGLDEPVAAGDQRLVELLQVALAAAHRARVQHAAHAARAVGERDIPEPARLEAEDADIALFPAGPAAAAAEVGEERHLAEPLDRAAPAVARGDERVAPARVHQEAGPDLARSRGLGE